MKQQMICLLGLTAVLACAGTRAEEGMSNADLAKELSNPNTSLGTLNFNLDYVSYEGDLRRSRHASHASVGCRRG